MNKRETKQAYKSSSGVSEASQSYKSNDDTNAQGAIKNILQ